MLRRILAVAAFLIVSAAATRAEDVPGVRYELTPVMSQGKLTAVAIELRFKGNADGRTSLMLPNAWGGEEELWKAIADLKITGDGVQIQPVSKSAQRDIAHAPGADIVVSYKIVQEKPGEPLAGGNTYRPVVQPGYFHLIGDAVFAQPAFDGTTSASFTVTGLPKGWRFASDLEHKRVLTLDEITESVLVGGDFRVLSRPGPGGKLRLALRGTWSFSDDKLADAIARIVTSHAAFWRDPEEPFLVTLIPLKSEGGHHSLGGTGRGDAFAFFVTSGDDKSDAQLNRLLAHEHMHTWIPRRLGKMPEKDEARDYWLSEGFTDFFAFRLLARDGISTAEEFAADFNQQLAAYWSSPARNVPNAKIVSDFWKDRYVQELPYQRGALMAVIWDGKLRALSNGARDLDSVVLDIKRRFMAAGTSAAPPPYAVDLFAAAMQSAGLNPADDIARYLEKGETILLPADSFGPCGTVATLDLPEFTRGFDPDKTSAAGNVITDIDPDGPAYAAGMRNGMKIIKREAGKPGDSRVEIVYRVDDNGTERLIRYKPEGKKRVTLQELQLTANMDAATREACVKRLGGV